MSAVGTPPLSAVTRSTGAVRVVGDLIADRYVLEARLGQGGAAEVWRARERGTGVVVALKLLTPQEAARPRSRARLLREGRLLGSVSHPHLVAIHAQSELYDEPYLALEHLAGGSLESRLRREGALSPRQVVAWLAPVAEALAALHAIGVVHRDLKPSNIVLGEDGRAVLVDVGTAWTADDPDRPSGLVGSRMFVAPEQRLDPSRAHPAADVYGLGATLYYLVTASSPFDLFLDVDNDARWVGVPRALASLVRSCCDVDPASRPSSASAVAEALRAITPRVGNRPLRRWEDALPSQTPWYDTAQPTARRGAVMQRGRVVLGGRPSDRLAAAREVVRGSSRRNQRLVVVDVERVGVASVASRLLGAETVAGQRSLGAVDEARGGTLFIDGLERLPLRIQAAMARVVEEGRYRPEGATSDEMADVQLVFGASLALPVAMSSGRVLAEVVEHCDLLVADERVAGS